MLKGYHKNRLPAILVNPLPSISTMRIAIDATALYGRYGGVEYALWNLLRALGAQAETIEYCVYIPHDGPPPALLQPFPKNWRWVRLPFRGDQRLKRILWQQLVLPLQLRARGCTLLHAPTYVLPLLNKVLNRSWRVPIILTVYDLIALESPQFATPSNRLHYGVMLPRSIHIADRIIVPSETVREGVLRQSLQAANKLRVVPLGVEPLFFQERSTLLLDEVRGRYSLPEKYLLFVGNFEPKKNLERILQALEKLPDAPPLVISGGARAWHAVQSTPGVQTIGYVRRRDLPALYAQCEAFVFPSLAEGFGLPVLEALASGAPVVTSTSVALPNLNDVVALCDPCSVESIAATIKRVLDNAAFSHHLRTAGKEYARPFTWSQAAQQTLEIYREFD